MPIFLHDKTEIETFLRREPYLHLYALGDLDDFFWLYTTWFADLAEDGQVAALFLMYSGGGQPTILALAGAERERLRELLQGSLPLLPRRFYLHLTPGLEDVLAPHFRLEPHGRFLKMALTDPARLGDIDTTSVMQFTPADEGSLRFFYDAAYPGNWFDPRMLETGCYFGIKQEGLIAAAAGIHVYSPRYRAAALGNITTAPEYRGQGLGTRVTARLCQHLLATVDTIGLNVRADNAPALAVYTRLGFTPAAEYDEYGVES